MKAIIRFICFASVVALAWAQPTRKSDSSRSSLTAADEAAIQAGSKAYEQGCNEKAWSKVVALFTDDVVFMAPHGPEVVGRAALEEFLRSFPPFRELRLERVEITGRGDLAVVRGRYSFISTPQTQPEQRESGKYAEIWRKQSGGGWKCARSIFNSDLAVPPGFALRSASNPNLAGPSLRRSTALSAADVEAIRSAGAAYIRAINDKAWSTAAGMLLEDGVIQAPNQPATIGRAAIENWMKEYPPARDLRVVPVEIEGRGDLAYARGRYSIAIMAPGRPELADVGKYIEIWRKQPTGGWMLQWDTFNSDQALVPDPSSAGSPQNARDVAAITAALYRAWDAAEMGDERAFDCFSTAPGVQFANVGSTPGLAEFRANWRDGMKRISRQILGDRETRVELLSPDIATSTSRGLYRSVSHAGVTSAAVPFAMTAVWQRQNGEWKIVNAHQSIHAEWTNADAAVVTSGTSDSMLEGTWVLNVARSRFSPGPGPRSETRTYSVTGDGAQRAIYDLVDADGKRHRGESIFKPDGREVPITGLDDADMQAVSRTGPRSLSAVIKKDGKVVRTANREVAEDGKSMTLAFKGTNAAGQPLDDLWVFERQSDDVVAAVKAAVAKHWSAINGLDWTTIANQHTADMNLVAADFDSRFTMNSPLGLAASRRYEGAKPNWTVRDVEVQVLSSSAAVATFYMEGGIRWPDGTTDARPRRVTEVWVKADGTWKEAHHHDSVYTPASAVRAAQ